MRGLSQASQSGAARQGVQGDGQWECGSKRRASVKDAPCLMFEKSFLLIKCWMCGLSSGKLVLLVIGCSQLTSVGWTLRPQNSYDGLRTPVTPTVSRGPVKTRIERRPGSAHLLSHQPGPFCPCSARQIQAWIIRLISGDLLLGDGLPWMTGTSVLHDAIPKISLASTRPLMCNCSFHLNRQHRLLDTIVTSVSECVVCLDKCTSEGF